MRDAPVKIAGAPGDARCALGMPGTPVHLASAYLKQGAPAIPKAHLCGPQVDFDNARRIALGIPGGAPWAEAGRAWVSGSLQPLSECECSSRRRKTAPPSVCRAAVISLVCALRCWAFGYFGRRQARRRTALEEMRPQKPQRPGLQVFTCTRFSTNSLSSRSSYVRLRSLYSKTHRTGGPPRRKCV
jgi:hypothetical protein